MPGGVRGGSPGVTGHLRGEGKSLPWIGKVLGVDHDTVAMWCSGVGNPTPEQANGTDGKIRPAARPTQDELADRREQAAEMRQSGGGSGRQPWSDG